MRDRIGKGSYWTNVEHRLEVEVVKVTQHVVKFKLVTTGQVKPKSRHYLVPVQSFLQNYQPLSV